MPYLSERQVTMLEVIRDHRGPWHHEPRIDGRTVRCLLRRGCIDWHPKRTDALELTLAGAYYLIGVQDGRDLERRGRARREHEARRAV